MTFSAEYEAFFAKGGKIDVQPGFEGYVHLPPSRGKKARRKSNELRHVMRDPKATRSHKTHGLLETEVGVTLLWIALECGYTSRTSLASNPNAFKFVPAPVATTGRFRQDIYNKEQALEAIAKIKEFRANAGRRRHKNHNLPDFFPGKE